MTAPLPVAKPAASSTALAMQARKYCEAGYDLQEAIGMVAQSLNARCGGDIFCALAQVGNAVRLERPGFEEGGSPSFTFGA